MNFLFHSEPLRLDEVTFFASGSNHSGEIRALALIPGAHVGVVAECVTDACPLARAELDRFALTGRRVFIDSGAFSEIKFGPTGPVVVKPLTDEHWLKVFGVYAEQALMHGSNCYVVAPDMVAFQAESLERLATYADDVRGIAALGATVLVPIQKGKLSMAEFYRQAFAILNAGDPDGGVEFRPAIPMKKDATSLADLAEFCRTIQPAAIHLLGIAPDTKQGRAAIQCVRDNAPACEISCDACLIKRWVGKSNGRKGQPRRLTELSDRHAAKLALDLEAVGPHEVHVRKVLSLFLAASSYWTDLGLAPVPEYASVDAPEDCQDLEPEYQAMAGALWGVPRSRAVARRTVGHEMSR